MSMQEINVKQYIGKQIDAVAMYADYQTQTKSRLIFRLDEDNPELRVSGYVDYNMKERFANGECNITVPITIVDAWFMEHNNGGRTNLTKYESINEYFADPSVKDRVFNISYGGLISRISYIGNPDEIDLVVTIELPNGVHSQLSSQVYEAEEPVEWYSERHQENQTFYFPKGFFEDAQQAIAYFADQSQDDIVGTRYSPVVVFPDSCSLEIIDDIVWMAKNHSKTLHLHGKYIVGTCCKSDEYQEIIEQCYTHGGQVAKHVQWDWD